jgi:hypothetical protein
MNVFLDGLSELGRNAGAILLFFSAALGAGVWLARLFPGEWKEQAWLLVPFGLTAGLVPLALLSMLFALLGWLWPPVMQIGHIGMAVLAVGGLLAWFLRDRKRVVPGVPAGAAARGGPVPAACRPAGVPEGTAPAAVQRRGGALPDGA